ncbi:hypothetical protein ERX37_09835 [Macrococcus hajekii]|uniref:Uncharacterized protein n=1 Tax=Macrococcus hajekii TaxID=198482 RepID=A0A4R6BHZ4_9STAP|nr:hypothetical protein [Macrococcus hajekii]TDM01172.1 hypothetical protein ERX37_09835 [Macrococcus hajekii]GGB11955.1 hypothetical protein GCM10007190_20040 [Macrococcus hajekii]
MRLQCRASNFDKILDSANNQHTLLRVLHFITLFNKTALEEKNPYYISSDYIMNINPDQQVPLYEQTQYK